ncbi:MAG TPA: hypothetical protein VGG88_05105 [Gaiellaceae bacterium]|jgi:hypothetical protein
MSISCIPDLGPNIAPDPVSAGQAAPFSRRMLANWLEDIEAFEAISQDADTRRIFLRMSAMSKGGSMPSFLNELARERGLDDETKGQLAEIAADRTFLLAVEEYLRRTQRFH